MNPEAYITATRQCVAQANSWSLEELHLDVTITDSHDKSTIPNDCFAVTGNIPLNYYLSMLTIKSFLFSGIKLQGAQCRNNQLLLTSSIMIDLPITLLRWTKSNDDRQGSRLSLPIYLNSTRTELLYTIDLNIAPGQEPHSFYERGVALLTSTALN